VPQVSAMSLIVPLQSFYATLTSILPSQYGWYCDQHSFFLYLGKCIDGRITLLQRSFYSSAHKVFSFRFDLQLAYQNGIVPTAGDYILLVIAATVGSSKSAHHTIQSIFVSAIVLNYSPRVFKPFFLMIITVGAAPVPAAGLVMIRKYHVLFSNCKHVDADIAAESREKLIAFPFVCVCHCLSVVAYSTAFGSTESKIPDGMAYLVAIE
jgi:hypothetical protein